MRIRGSDRRIAVAMFFGVLVVGAWAGVARAEKEEPIELPPGVDENFYAGWGSSIEDQVRMISSAFGLDADGEQSLRQEIMVRLALQKDYEAKMNAEIAELAKQVKEKRIVDDENAPEVIELNRRFRELTEGMPLNEWNVEKWMEAHVPPETAAQGRQRFGELLERQRFARNQVTIDQRALASRKAQLAQSLGRLRARPEIESQDPLPYGRPGTELQRRSQRAASRNVVTPSAGAVAASPAVAPAVPAAVKPAEAAKPASVPMPAKEVLAPAPPLDDWDKHLILVAEKYGFTDAQLTNARSILNDLRRRAYQYQASRAEDYARVKLMDDAGRQKSELARLNKPLDALFSELKLRLESLPTLEQRSKAGGQGK